MYKVVSDISRTCARIVAMPFSNWPGSFIRLHTLTYFSWMRVPCGYRATADRRIDDHGRWKKNKKIGVTNVSIPYSLSSARSIVLERMNDNLLQCSLNLVCLGTPSCHSTRSYCFAMELFQMQRVFLFFHELIIEIISMDNYAAC